MQSIVSVGIKKLKNSLSAYIREVKSGNVILITDHGTVVAEMRSPQESYQDLEIKRLMQEWVDANKLILPAEAKKTLCSSPVKLPAGTAARLIEKERGES